MTGILPTQGNQLAPSPSPSSTNDREIAETARLVGYSAGLQSVIQRDE
jgi:hypothetical protein